MIQQHILFQRCFQIGWWLHFPIVVFSRCFQFENMQTTVFRFEHRCFWFHCAIRPLSISLSNQKIALLSTPMWWRLNAIGSTVKLLHFRRSVLWPFFSLFFRISSNAYDCIQQCTYIFKNKIKQSKPVLPNNTNAVNFQSEKIEKFCVIMPNRKWKTIQYILLYFPN